MALEAVTENVWTLRSPMRFPLIGDIGTRMTIIRLRDNSLMLISPVKFGEELKREIQALGTVRYLIGPNSQHHLFLAHARSAFPQAKVYGPASLQEKRKDLPFADYLNEHKTYPWSEELSLLHFPGRAQIDEYVFFHHASKTLVVTDLVFNLKKGQSVVSKCALKMNGAIGFGMTRIGKYIFKDRTMLKKQLARLLAWAPERIVVTHGEVVSSEGKSRLESSFQWLTSKSA